MRSFAVGNNQDKRREVLGIISRPEDTAVVDVESASQGQVGKSSVAAGTTTRQHDACVEKARDNRTACELLKWEEEAKSK